MALHGMSYIHTGCHAFTETYRVRQVRPHMWPTKTKGAVASVPRLQQMVVGGALVRWSFALLIWYCFKLCQFRYLDLSWMVGQLVSLVMLGACATTDAYLGDAQHVLLRWLKGIRNVSVDPFGLSVLAHGRNCRATPVNASCGEYTCSSRATWRVKFNKEGCACVAVLRCSFFRFIYQSTHCSSLSIHLFLQNHFIYTWIFTYTSIIYAYTCLNILYLCK